MNIASALCDSGKQRPKSGLAVQVDYADFDAQHIIQLSVTAKSQFNVGTAVAEDSFSATVQAYCLPPSCCTLVPRLPRGPQAERLQKLVRLLIDEHLRRFLRRPRSRQALGTVGDPISRKRRQGGVAVEHVFVDMVERIDGRMMRVFVVGGRSWPMLMPGKPSKNKRPRVRIKFCGIVHLNFTKRRLLPW